LVALGKGAPSVDGSNSILSGERLCSTIQQCQAMTLQLDKAGPTVHRFRCSVAEEFHKDCLYGAFRLLEMARLICCIFRSDKARMITSARLSTLTFSSHSRIACTALWAVSAANDRRMSLLRCASSTDKIFHMLRAARRAAAN